MDSSFRTIKKKSRAILAISIVSITAISYIFLKQAVTYMSGYLSKSEEVEADILVVEGWLPFYALERAYDEYRKNRYKYVVTTGVRYTPLYYKISDNGYLIFYTHYILSGMDKPGSHSVEIKAYSDLGGKNRAHFNLFINDSLTGSFYAEKRKQGYTVQWNGRLKDIDSVMVQYDNDIYEPPLDRNLSVSEVRFDNSVSVPYLFHSDYDMLKLDGKLRFRNNLTTTAELARSHLLRMGIDSSRVVAVSADKSGFNRTLTSALEFRKWLNSQDKDLKGINIISLGTHSRRTWMTYNKILDEKYRIGIIAIPEEPEDQASGKSKAFKTLRETLGIIYYWFILLPY
jgi:hypothetical protein